MTDWVIEPMRPDRDLDAVVALQAASFVNPWTREMFSWELQNSDVSHIFVLRRDPEGLAGFCSCWLIFDELHINNIAIQPSLRGRGLGTLLMEEVIRRAIELGAARATLEVRPSNVAARRLYDRLGFRAAGLRPKYYRNPEEDALILWKDRLAAPASPRE